MLVVDELPKSLSEAASLISAGHSLAEVGSRTRAGPLTVAEQAASLLMSVSRKVRVPGQALAHRRAGAALMAQLRGVKGLRAAQARAATSMVLGLWEDALGASMEEAAATGTDGSGAGRGSLPSGPTGGRSEAPSHDGASETRPTRGSTASSSSPPPTGGAAISPPPPAVGAGYGKVTSASGRQASTGGSQDHQDERVCPAAAAVSSGAVPGAAGARLVPMLQPQEPAQTANSLSARGLAGPVPVAPVHASGSGEASRAQAVSGTPSTAASVLPPAESDTALESDLESGSDSDVAPSGRALSASVEPAGQGEAEPAALVLAALAAALRMPASSAREPSLASRTNIEAGLGCRGRTTAGKMPSPPASPTSPESGLTSSEDSDDSDVWPRLGADRYRQPRRSIPPLPLEAARPFDAFARRWPARPAGARMHAAAERKEPHQPDGVHSALRPQQGARGRIPLGLNAQREDARQQAQLIGSTATTAWGAVANSARSGSQHPPYPAAGAVGQSSSAGQLEEQRTLLAGNSAPSDVAASPSVAPDQPLRLRLPVVSAQRLGPLSARQAREHTSILATQGAGGGALSARSVRSCTALAYVSPVASGEWAVAGASRATSRDWTGRHEYVEAAKSRGDTASRAVVIGLARGDVALRHHRLTPAGVHGLAAAIRASTVLRALELVDCDVRDAGALELADSLTSSVSLESLALGDHPLGPQASLAIVRAAAAAPALARLLLSSAAVGDSADSAKAVQRLLSGASPGGPAVPDHTPTRAGASWDPVPRSPSGAGRCSVRRQLRQLDLSFAKAGNTVALAIADGLKHAPLLSRLSLAYNAIQPRGCSHLLAAAAGHTSLRLLDLSWNNCGELGGLEAAGAIADNCLGGGSLRSLLLAHCSISEPAVLLLADALQFTSTLRRLALDMNPCGELAAAAVQAAAAANTKLRQCTTLDVEQTGSAAPGAGLAAQAFGSSAEAPEGFRAASNRSASTMAQGGATPARMAALAPGHVWFADGCAGVGGQARVGGASRADPRGPRSPGQQPPSRMRRFRLEEPDGDYRLDLSDPTQRAVARSLLWRVRAGHGAWTRASLNSRVLEASATVEGKWAVPMAGNLALSYTGRQALLDAGRVDSSPAEPAGSTATRRWGRVNTLIAASRLLGSQDAPSVAGARSPSPEPDGGRADDKAGSDAQLDDGLLSSLARSARLASSSAFRSPAASDDGGTSPRRFAARGERASRNNGQAALGRRHVRPTGRLASQPSGSGSRSKMRDVTDAASSLPEGGVASKRESTLAKAVARAEALAVSDSATARLLLDLRLSIGRRLAALVLSSGLPPPLAESNGGPSAGAGFDPEETPDLSARGWLARACLQGGKSSQGPAHSPEGPNILLPEPQGSVPREDVVASPSELVRLSNSTRLRKEHGSGPPFAAVSVVSALLGGAPIPLGAFGGGGARILLQRAAVVLSSTLAPARSRKHSPRRLSAPAAEGSVGWAGTASLGTLPRQLADARIVSDDGPGSSPRHRQSQRGQAPLLLDVRVACVPAKQAEEACRQAQLACWHASALWQYNGVLATQCHERQDRGGSELPGAAAGPVVPAPASEAASKRHSADLAARAAARSGLSGVPTTETALATGRPPVASAQCPRPPAAFQPEPPGVRGSVAAARSPAKRRPRLGRTALPQHSLEGELAEWFRAAALNGFVPRPPPGRLGSAASPLAAAAAGLAFPGGGPPPCQLPPFVFRREVKLRLNRPGDRALAIQLLQRTIPGAAPLPAAPGDSGQSRLGAGSASASKADTSVGPQDSAGAALAGGASPPDDKGSRLSLAQPDAILEARLNGKVVPVSKWRRFGPQPDSAIVGAATGKGSTASSAPVAAGSTASLESAVSDVSQGGDSVGSGSRGGARWALPRSGSLCLVFEARTVVAVASQPMTFDTGLPGQRALLAATAASSRVNSGESIWAVSVDGVRLDWAASTALLDPWPPMAAHASEPGDKATSHRAAGGVATGPRGLPAKAGATPGTGGLAQEPRHHGILPLLPQGCRVSLERTVVRPAFQAPALQVTRLTLDMQRPEDVLLAQAVRARTCLSAAGRLANPAHALAAIGSSLIQLPCACPGRAPHESSPPDAKPSQTVRGHSEKASAPPPGRPGAAAAHRQLPLDPTASSSSLAAQLRKLGTGSRHQRSTTDTGRKRVPGTAAGAGTAQAPRAPIAAAESGLTAAPGVGGLGEPDARGPPRSTPMLGPHASALPPHLVQGEQAKGWSGVGPRFAVVEGAIVTATDALQHAARNRWQVAHEPARVKARPESSGRRLSAASRSARRKSMVAPLRRASMDAKRAPAVPSRQGRTPSMASSTSSVAAGDAKHAADGKPTGASRPGQPVGHKPTRPRRGSSALGPSRERRRSAVSFASSAAEGGPPSQAGAATSRANRAAWDSSALQTPAMLASRDGGSLKDTLEVALDNWSSDPFDPAARAAAALGRVAEAQGLLQEVPELEGRVCPTAWPWSASAVLPVCGTADAAGVVQLQRGEAPQLGLFGTAQGSRPRSAALAAAVESQESAKPSAAKPNSALPPMPALVAPGSSSTPAELLASAPERDEAILSMRLDGHSVAVSALLLPTWTWPATGRLELEVMFSAGWPTLATGAVRALSDHMTALPNDAERLSLLQATLEAVSGSQGKHLVAPDSAAQRDPARQWAPGLRGPATGLSAAQALLLCRVMSFPASMEAAAAMCSPYVVDALLLPRLHSLVAEAVGEQMQAEAFDLGQM